MTLTYNIWLERIDAILVKMVGLGIDDLADVAYPDLYEDMLSPLEAVHEVLLENAYPEEYL